MQFCGILGPKVFKGNFSIILWPDGLPMMNLDNTLATTVCYIILKLFPLLVLFNCLHLPP
jgi:hypothetical protein